MVPQALVSFFYLLGRDQLPLGAVEGLVALAEESAGAEAVYSNADLERYAREVAERLTRIPEKHPIMNTGTDASTQTSEESRADIFGAEDDDAESYNAEGDDAEENSAGDENFRKKCPLCEAEARHKHGRTQG